MYHFMEKLHFIFNCGILLLWMVFSLMEFMFGWWYFLWWSLCYVNDVCGISNYIFLYILFTPCSHGSWWKVFIFPSPFHLMPRGMCNSMNVILNGTHMPAHNFEHALIYGYNKYMYMLVCGIGGNGIVEMELVH